MRFTKKQLSESLQKAKNKYKFMHKVYFVFGLVLGFGSAIPATVWFLKQYPDLVSQYLPFLNF